MGTVMAGVMAGTGAVFMVGMGTVMVMAGMGTVMAMAGTGAVMVMAGTGGGYDPCWQRTPHWLDLDLR